MTRSPSDDPHRDGASVSGRRPGHDLAPPEVAAMVRPDTLANPRGVTHCPVDAVRQLTRSAPSRRYPGTGEHHELR